MKLDAKLPGLEEAVASDKSEMHVADDIVISSLLILGGDLQLGHGAGNSHPPPTSATLPP